MEHFQNPLPLGMLVQMNREGGNQSTSVDDIEWNHQCQYQLSDTQYIYMDRGEMWTENMDNCIW